MINFELDFENIFLKENIDSSFRDVFLIQKFSVDVKNERPQIDHFFEEEFCPKKKMSFGVILDSKSNICDFDFRTFFNIKTFDVFCEDTDDKRLDEKFENCFHNEILEDFPFKISLNENGTVNNSVFKKYFKIPDFQTSLDVKKRINDTLFEQYFNTDKEHDYNIINNLKKNLNSRKIITREERERIPEVEPETFHISQEKKQTFSIEENLKNSESLIKENIFYKIVEFNPSEITEIDTPELSQIPTQIDTSYKEEIDQKIIDLENKYEDLLQKTVNDYQSKIQKMLEDFSTFRNNVTQQVNRMSFISSATGGGAVNILDMDDVDKTNLQNGYTLSYNNSLKKFEFINGSSTTFDRMQADVFEVEQIDLTNNFIDISAPADSNYYELSEFHVNGIVNIYQTNYTFLSSTRIDISNLILNVGDIVRIVYIKS